MISVYLAYVFSPFSTSAEGEGELLGRLCVYPGQDSLSIADINGRGYCYRRGEETEERKEQGTFM